MTWHEDAACLRIDPREFDDRGTPTAWDACRRCPVTSDCLADAFAHGIVHGVYRGGVSFGDKKNKGVPHDDAPDRRRMFLAKKAAR